MSIPREIPKLQLLCLRHVGSHSCSAEETFSYDPETGEPSQASRLLRKFHERPVVATDLEEEEEIARASTQQDKEELLSLTHVPMTRTPIVGKGSSRRAQANDVDLNHPIVAHNYSSANKSDSEEVENNNNNNTSSKKSKENILVMEYGNSAIDCLQAHIDSLVELGRMDDGRLSVHFFEEWKANVLVAAGKPVEKKITKKPNAEEAKEEGEGPPPAKRSRRRSSADTTAESNTTTTLRLSVKAGPPPPLGSLSLNNCAVSEDTIEAMCESQMGIHLGVLDLTGIYQLSDVMLERLLPHCPHLKRLSLKNCRRLTQSSLNVLAQYQTKLECLDIGGTYNVTPQQVLQSLVIGNNSNNNSNKNKPCPNLVELHASGLGWTDADLQALVQGKYINNNEEEEEMDVDEVGHKRSWRALSIGFSLTLTPKALRTSLLQVSDTLISLALHFCESLVDNALMGVLGRNLRNVRYLDVRGNPALNSMTGWYDGRASADFHVTQDEEGNTTAADVPELLVLARFTGITKASLEETLRIHPLQATKLTCILDGGGHGLGVFR